MSRSDLTITSYTVVDLLSWQESDSFRVSPKFQRRSVWGTAAKSYFIESILGGYPIPPIHVRLVPTIDGRMIREVIDGQQRVRAVFDFMAGRFRIPRSVSDQWGGASYESLTDDEREAISLFSFTAYQYKKLTDEEVLDIFARLNTYSVSLNAQELRNGRFFGRFKQTNFRLAQDTLEFWRANRIFSETQIARMREVEFIAELIVAQMDGLQDKKKSINKFYSELDERWSSEPIGWQISGEGYERVQPESYLSAQAAESRFKETLADLEESVGPLIRTTRFRRPALFYTLFTAVYHFKYGLPGHEDAPYGASGLKPDVVSRLVDAVSLLADAMESEGKIRDERILQFMDAAARQTDNLVPRTTRLLSLLALVSKEQ